MHKKVSVLVATYNGEKYIVEQLDSIYNQIYKNIEIVIVDDASQDNTVFIVRNWAKNKRDVQFHVFDENVGYVRNFERGLKLCTGDYISLADQDDIWCLNKTEELINGIGKSDLIYCNSMFINEKGECVSNSFSDNNNMIDSNNPYNFLIRNCVSGHAMLFNKSLLPDVFEFPPYIVHDRWIAFLAAANNGVKYLDKKLVQYRIHNTNALGGKKRVKKAEEDKIKEASIKIKYLMDALPAVYTEEKKSLDRVYNSYINNTFFSKIIRVYFFLRNYKAIFKISKKSKYKKMFYALTMFSRIR